MRGADKPPITGPTPSAYRHIDQIDPRLGLPAAGYTAPSFHGGDVHDGGKGASHSVYESRPKEVAVLIEEASKHAKDASR